MTETMRRFVCQHLGNCCTNPVAPVNLTVGDIIRIMASQGESAKNLFGKTWSMVPFGNPVSKFSYSVEPGLETPCLFRGDKKCLVYAARPLNCRLFPYWILAEIDVPSMKKAFTREDLCCAFNCSPSNEMRKKYKAYVDALSIPLENETKLTNEILQSLGLKKFVEIPKTSTEFFNDFLAVTFSGVQLNKMQAEHQLMVAKTLIKQEEFMKFAEYIDTHVEDLQHRVATADELNKLTSHLDVQ